MTEETSAGPFKLKSRTVKQWVDEFCQDSDELQVIKTKDGFASLLNKRTNTCFLLNDLKKESLPDLLEFAVIGYMKGYDTAVELLQTTKPTKETIENLVREGLGKNGE
jgi:hypothetical protein